MLNADDTEKITQGVPAANLDPECIPIVEQEAEMIRHIFAECVAGRSPRAIAERLSK